MRAYRVVKHVRPLKSGARPPPVAASHVLAADREIARDLKIGNPRVARPGPESGDADRRSGVRICTCEEILGLILIPFGAEAEIVHRARVDRLSVT